MDMVLIIDLAIIVIIGLCIFLGYRKGLIGVAFKILSFFIALIVAVTLSTPLANFIINNTEVDDSIQSAIQDKFISTDEQMQEGQEVEVSGKDSFSQEIVKYINGTVSQVKNDSIKVISHNLTILIIRVIVAIGLYIVTKFILYFFRKIADVIAEIPIIKQFNKLGGLIYGVLEGVLIVYVVLAIASLLAPMISNTEFFVAINNSFIGSIMYNNNLILKILL